MHCNIASKTGHPFQVVVPGEDRRQLDLPAVSFEDSVMRQYEKQTRLILEAALGQGAIRQISGGKPVSLPLARRGLTH